VPENLIANTGSGTIIIHFTTSLFDGLPVM